MPLTVTNEAARWFIEEMKLNAGDSIKFYGKVYGPYNGFSFGLEILAPSQPYVSLTVEEIQFYIEEMDAWFFNDKELHISMKEGQKEPQFDIVIKD